MKLKVFTALFLVLAMMFSVATPVMAAAPIKGVLETTTSTPAGASGKYAFTMTRDKHIVVTATLSGVTPNKKFTMVVYRDNYLTEMYVDKVSTSRGTLKISGVGYQTFESPSTHDYRISIWEDGVTFHEFVAYRTITFP